jgi:hypothetical protein
MADGSGVAGPPQSLEEPPTLQTSMGFPSRPLNVQGSKFDLNALFGFSMLQDLLQTLSAQQDSQLELIKQLREDLTAANKAGKETAERLQAEIDLKATEKALVALQTETSRADAAMQKKQEQFEDKVEKRFDKVDQRLDSQQSKLYDCKVALDTKAEQRSLEALTTRVDGCATAVELADAKLAMKMRVDEVETATTKRHDATDAIVEQHSKRIGQTEDVTKTFASREEVKAVELRYQQADEKISAEIAAVEARAGEALEEAIKPLDARHARAEENLERHWTHIRNVEEMVRTKADREMVQQGIDKAAADTAAVDAKYSTITSEHIASTEAYQSQTDGRLDSAEARLDEAEASIVTKATLEETKELREKLALCSLRTEMRELLEGLRQETSSRVRILKERLDRTDRELLRQLEDSQTNDRADKFDALAAVVETKADKALTERWLEASQQLHSELQTVHVRTQTLGQGMKVVLGWVEGMADKVTGLQGQQQRMAQQVQSQREEQQFALNATARETISKVKGMLNTQAAAPPPQTPVRSSGFEPSKPLSRPTTSEGGRGGPGGGIMSRPTTSEGGRGGPVVLKQPHQPSATVDAVSAAAAIGGAIGDENRAPGSMDMQGSALAGPAGAALAGALPTAGVAGVGPTGVMGKSALEQIASDSHDGLSGGAQFDGAHQPFRSEAERRKHNLDQKRRDLVETRMLPQPPPMADITEPRPPSQPRPDPRMGFAHPISPRHGTQGLELEGQPPPAVITGGA